MSNAIAHLNGRPRGSTWVANHTLYPYPVYVAELADGTTRRRTFWQEAGKPWNFARGRNLCGDFSYWARGYIEHNGQRFMDTGEDTPQRAKRGPTAAQLKKLLSRVLEADEAAVREAQELLAA